MKGTHSGAAATYGLSGIRVWSDHSDGLHSRFVERQQVAVVPQEHNTRAGSLQSHDAARNVVDGNRKVGLFPVQPAELHDFPEDAADVVVDGSLTDLACFDCGQQRGAIHVRPGRHLEIKASMDGGHSVIGRIPIRHDDSVEAPFFLGHIIVEITVLRHVLAIGEVVGIHDRAHMALLHGGFECGQINFEHGALVDQRVDVVPVVFLVVAHVVLDGGANTFGLQALDIGNGSPGCEVRIFAKIFEIATSHGCTIDVYARAEKNVDTASAGVVTEDSAYFVD